MQKKCFQTEIHISFLGVQCLALNFIFPGDECLFHCWSFISLLELLILFSRCLRFTVYKIKIYSSSFLTIFASWLLLRIQVLRVCDPFWCSVQVSMVFLCKCRCIFFQTFLSNAMRWEKRCGVNKLIVYIIKKYKKINTIMCFSTKTLTFFGDLGHLSMNLLF